MYFYYMKKYKELFDFFSKEDGQNVYNYVHEKFAEEKQQDILNNCLIAFCMDWKPKTMLEQICFIDNKTIAWSIVGLEFNTDWEWLMRAIKSCVSNLSKSEQTISTALVNTMSYRDSNNRMDSREDFFNALISYIITKIEIEEQKLIKKKI